MNRLIRFRILLPGTLALGLALLTPGNATAQKPPRPPSGGGQRVPTAAVMSEGALLVAAQAETQVVVWDRESGKIVATVEADALFRGSIAGEVMALVGDQGPLIRRGRGLARVIPLKAPKVLAWSRTTLSGDGRVVALAYPRDHGVRDPDQVGLWNTETGEPIATLDLSPARVQGVTFSRDGAILAVYGDVKDRKAVVQVVRRKGQRLTPILRWESERHLTTFSAALSPDGKRLFVGAGSSLLLWHVGQRRPPREVATDAVKTLFPAALRGPEVRMPGAHSLALSADGQTLACLHAFGVVGVSLWQTDTLKPVTWLKRPDDGGTMRQLGWDKAGRLWLISATYSPDVWLHAPRGDRFATVRVLRGP